MAGGGVGAEIAKVESVMVADGSPFPPAFTA
jgi:hypothetical protein